MSRDNTLYIVDAEESTGLRLLMTRQESGWDVSIRYTSDCGLFDSKTKALTEAIEELKILMRAANGLLERAIELREEVS